MLKRLSIFTYGLICYAVFLATFLYALGFVGNFGVPHSIDGEPRMYFSTALLIDLTLLGIFAIQHSLMARPYFKRWLTQFIPASAERSTYVLFSSLALIALFAWWEPIGGMVWDVADPVSRVNLTRTVVSITPGRPSPTARLRQVPPTEVIPTVIGGAPAPQ